MLNLRVKISTISHSYLIISINGINASIKQVLEINKQINLSIK